MLHKGDVGQTTFEFGINYNRAVVFRVDNHDVVSATVLLPRVTLQFVMPAFVYVSVCVCTRPR